MKNRYSLDLFKKSNLSYDWNTIYVGWVLTFISPKEVRQYALDYMENNPDCVNENISELILEKLNQEGIEVLLKKILKDLNYEMPVKNSKSWNLEWSKWRYAKLNEANKNRSDQLELLDDIEEVYNDFGYPVDMRNLICWFSPDDKEFYLLPDQRQKTVIDKFHIFLDGERKKIESGNIPNLTPLLND